MSDAISTLDEAASGVPKRRLREAAKAAGMRTSEAALNLAVSKGFGLAEWSTAIRVAKVSDKKTVLEKHVAACAEG